MKAGDLDRRVTIERPAVVVDEVYGPQAGGWAVFAARVPAQVQDVLPSKAESVEGGLRMADLPARVRIRYLRGLASDMRIVVHGAAGEVDRVCEISGGPAEIGRREWIEFIVKEYSS